MAIKQSIALVKTHSVIVTCLDTSVADAKAQDILKESQCWSHNQLSIMVKGKEN